MAVARHEAKAIVQALYETTFAPAGLSFAIPCIVSFCSHRKDHEYERSNGLLSQWRAYGPAGDRFTLVFDTKKIEQLLDVESKEYSYIYPADVVLFPELVLSAGYSLGDKFNDLAEAVPGPTTTALGRKARKHKMYIVAGIAERDLTGTVCNTAVIIGRDGEFVGSYRKTHLFTPAESFFAPGTDLSVFDLDFGRVALPICYDLEFPEAGRVWCLKGAELLLSIAAHWIGTGSVGSPANFITTFCAARSLENRVPVVLSNRVGFDPGLSDNFVGLSRIVDADGMTITAMTDDREGMVTATLDLNEQRWKRLSYNYFRDREPRLYSGLAQSD